MTKIVNIGQSEKKARVRENKVEDFLDQVSIGLSAEQQQMLLQILHSTTGEDYFIGKKKKRTDGVKFVQLIMDNVNYLNKIGYLQPKEEAFLFKLTPYIEFKTNVIIERVDNDLEVETNAATPSYLAEQFGNTREYISRIMNSLLKKGILGVAEAGMTTDDGRICSSRTWFVNPNIMCCSPKDGVDKATQHIFKRSLRNFKVKDTIKKHKLPVYLF
ncbi:MarR family transcriptional regulator [Bacillus sp. GX]|uniref:MarR family transcriptional regulator n=1 Tax=Bacillus TaxID=1386 RepID=UPI001009BFCB|nr:MULTISPECIES: MarR family transcriptional regulator [Bacillus]MEB9686008.1 MarR family transcriptional regulator [Bacillus anthracis]RXJ09871.1 MarR family transcriptional regulator [Bacillus albus]RXJ21772.1 MarR family transcriptional regulator [Bacillus albus]RXJ22808.1 MarR family transcriptional regulator [Bacillus albus]RXJ33825.1 MarR family transcriptional regulator [Bacillus albus]